MPLYCISYAINRLYLLSWNGQNPKLGGVCVKLNEPVTEWALCYVGENDNLELCCAWTRDYSKVAMRYHELPEYYKACCCIAQRTYTPTVELGI